MPYNHAPLFWRYRINSTNDAIKADLPKEEPPKDESKQAVIAAA